MIGLMERAVGQRNCSLFRTVAATCYPKRTMTPRMFARVEGDRKYDREALHFD